MATEQPAAEKATPSNLATEISLYFENTTDHAEAVDHIIEAHSRVVCSYCGDATVESMAVKDGVWTTDARELMQAHVLICPKRPERKLLDIVDVLAAALEAAKRNIQAAMSSQGRRSVRCGLSILRRLATHRRCARTA